MQVFYIFLLVVLIVFIILATYYGGFHKIRVDENEEGGELMVYLSFEGDYKQGTRVIDGIHRDLAENYNYKANKGVGIYYDDPKKVDVDNLRSDLGVLIEDASQEIEEQIKKDYTTKYLPKATYYTATFPFRGRISIVLSIFKVYPHLNASFPEDKPYDSEVIEIYDAKNKVIRFRKPKVFSQTI